MFFFFDLVLVVGGDCCPHLRSEFLSCAGHTHQLGLHPFGGYGRVGFGRFVDVFQGLGDQLVVLFDSPDLRIGLVVGFAA